MRGRRVYSYAAFFKLPAPVYRRAEVEYQDQVQVAWYIRPPCGHNGLLAAVPLGAGHEIDEHEDGSISVQPKPNNSNSILCHCGWHGYIDHGHFNSI